MLFRQRHLRHGVPWCGLCCTISHVPQANSCCCKKKKPLFTFEDLIKTAVPLHMHFLCQQIDRSLCLRLWTNPVAMYAGTPGFIQPLMM